MQEFVQSHLVSTLNPIHEEVSTIRNVMHEIEGRMTKFASQIARQSTKIEEQEHELQNLNSAIAAKDSRMTAMHQLILATRAENSDIRGNTDSTKAALDKVDDKWQAACSFQPVVDLLVDIKRDGFFVLQNTSFGSPGHHTSKHQGTIGVLQNLQLQQDKQASEIRKLYHNLQASDQKASDIMETRLNNLNSFCKELCNQQRDMENAINTLRAQEDETREKLKNADVIEKFGLRDVRTKAIEAKLTSLTQEIEKPIANLRATDKELQHVKGKVAILESQNFHNQICELVDSMKDFARRLATAEEEIVQVRRKSAEQFHVRDKLLRKLDDKATKHSMDLTDLTSAQKADIEHLAALQANLAPVLVKTRQTEDSGSGGDQPDNGLSFDDELKELRENYNSQRDVLDKYTTKLDMIQHLLDSLKQKEQRDFDSSHTQISGLQEDLGDANALLSKLDARVELVQKYFTGLGRGLQDTHTAMTGDSSVLPQKNVKQLPTLPASTPRGGLFNDPRSRTPTRQGLFARPLGSLPNDTGVPGPT
eukprot:symbB.v1.2.024448.t1/scaffold2318.1/size82491/2